MIITFVTHCVDCIGIVVHIICVGIWSCFNVFLFLPARLTFKVFFFFHIISLHYELSPYNHNRLHPNSHNQWFVVCRYYSDDSGNKTNVCFVCRLSIYAQRYDKVVFSYILLRLNGGLFIRQSMINLFRVTPLDSKHQSNPEKKSVIS